MRQNCWGIFGAIWECEDNHTRSTVHVMETRNFRPAVSSPISKQEKFPRESFTTTPRQQGMTGIYLFLYLKSSKLYKVAHPTRGVLRLNKYMYTKFIYKKYQGIKEI